MTKTEKLIESLAEMLWTWEEPITQWEEVALPEYVKAVGRNKAQQLLKVCKEAGLQFVNKDTKFGEFTPINPIEVE